MNLIRKNSHLRARDAHADMRGSVVGGVVTFLLLISVAVGAMWWAFGTIVPLGYTGIRKIAFGPGQGLQDRALRPGYHWTIPGYSTVYLIPQGVRLLHFDRELPESSESFGTLGVSTIDGTTVEVDVTIAARFFSEHAQDNGNEHGGPRELIQNVGATEQQWDRYVGQVAENELKRTLSALSTVEFYSPTAREDKVIEAQQNLQKLLAPVGVSVEAVLLKRYTYRPEIDEAIFKKNLQELEMAFNKVSGDFAEAQRDVNKVETDGDVTIQNLDKQGSSEAEKIRSDGDLYKRQKMAEADLLVAEARASVDKLRSEVLSKPGADIYVAIKTAKLLSSLKGGVLSALDPYDFEGWMRRLTTGDAPPRNGGNQ